MINFLQLNMDRRGVSDDCLFKLLENSHNSKNPIHICILQEPTIHKLPLCYEFLSTESPQNKKIL